MLHKLPIRLQSLLPPAHPAPRPGVFQFELKTKQFVNPPVPPTFVGAAAAAFKLTAAARIMCFLRARGPIEPPTSILYQTNRTIFAAFQIEFTLGTIEVQLTYNSSPYGTPPLPTSYHRIVGLGDRGIVALDRTVAGWTWIPGGWGARLLSILESFCIGE